MAYQRESSYEVVDVLLGLLGEDGEMTGEEILGYHALNLLQVCTGSFGCHDNQDR